MRLSEQERSAAQADLDRLTGELVRLYQLREQLKLALNEGGNGSSADSSGTAGSITDEGPLPIPFKVVTGNLACEATRDDAQRLALRSQLQIIRGGLS